MQKIISLFCRNYETDHLVRDEVVPGAEWVINGEGIATRKFDGTCCLIRDNKLYKRYELKKGNNPPKDFEPATEMDEVTGKQQGWVPVYESDKWHVKAWGNLTLRSIDNKPLHPSTVERFIADGTYELIGEKVQGNPEGIFDHKLVKHGDYLLRDCPRTFNEIKSYLEDKDIEGVVWHHPDGRMVKIKGRDFGIKRKQKN